MDHEQLIQEIHLLEDYDVIALARDQKDNPLIQRLVLMLDREFECAN